MEERSRGLESLPWELLREIQLLSLSASLPLVSRAVRQSLSHPSPTFAAIYLLDLYAPPKVPVGDVLARALRHGICSLETVREMERIWDRRRGVRPVNAEQKSSATCYLQGEQEEEEHEEEDEPPPEPSAPPLSLSELPRRIFRVPALHPPKTILSPLLKYLFEKYTPSADSHQGYALSRATLLSDRPLIDFLLTHGADPNQRDAFAVQIAVSKADLALVKLLVERKEQGGKRRRMQDRVQVTQTLVRRAMQNDRTPEGRAIIDYFVNEKGSVPSLNSILKMGSKRPSKRSRVRA